ncbi:GntR family transcriptional regulator [Salsipaludibacter albus]|uniref:GntR family transcriptional regulator n=1 Tax=Salsipaludibacter albus TaxID=2849650 RepID=UPI001EE404E1|nr:GntR family transcriptional regulator [Salsipaludibacter albus]MBY5162155.1 GntR family transcriptional regulator [Salsipaludibacter albus]
MSTVDEVQRHVVRGLLRGEFAPGSWLRQDELATRIGVSRVPVREGLQRLAGLGLVRFEPNRGAVVPELTAADAIETYALRRGIEPRLLDQALPRLSIVDLAEAELALEPHEVAASPPDGAGRSSGDLEDGPVRGSPDVAADGPVSGLSPTEANWAFHRALYRAAGWQRGLAMVEILHAAVAPYVLLYTRKLGGAATSHAEHVELLAACRARDRERAQATLADHLDHAETALVDWLRRDHGD